VIISVTGEVLSSAVVAYAFSRLQWKGRDILFVIVIATMMLPGQVTLIPIFILYRQIGWLDTFLPLTVPSWVGNAFYIFLLRQYFMTISKDMDEAAVIDGALEYGQKCRADRQAGQGSLFSPGAGQDNVGKIQERYPDLPEWDEKTRLAHEKASLGFYVTGHPLESFRELLGEFATHSTVQLREGSVQGEVAVGGIVTDLRKRKSRKTGAWWALLRLEDLEGLVEVLVFPKTYEGCQKYLENDRAILLSGKLETDEDRVRIVASSVAPLEALRESRADAVQVRLEAADLDADLVTRLREAVAAHHGEAQLFLEVARHGSFRLVAKAEPALRVTPSQSLTRDLEAVVGSGRVRYRARPIR